MTTTDLTTTTPSDLQVFTGNKNLGVAAALSANDIQLPSLMLMQANSTFTQESKDINSGDFIHSITMDRWGGQADEPVELVFFDMFQ